MKVQWGPRKGLKGKRRGQDKKERTGERREKNGLNRRRCGEGESNLQITTDYNDT